MSDMTQNKTSTPCEGRIRWVHHWFVRGICSWCGEKAR